MEVKGTEPTEMAIRSDGDRDGPEAESPGFKIGVPTGIRTPVASVKGMCPRPLDDGDAGLKNRSVADMKSGGARRDRTADLLHAMQALSQLSYGPLFVRYCILRRN